MKYKKHLKQWLYIFVFIAFLISAFRLLLPKFFPLQGNPLSMLSQSVYDESDEVGIFHNEKVFSYKLPENPLLANVLGESQADKRIEVDLTNQRIYAFEGDRKVYDFPVSSGLYDWTPRGTFRIWIKLRYTKMEGGSPALGTYYYLPNVPFTMYFSNSQIPPSKGFGVHGAYWHNDFGRPKSHGCINLRISDAEALYYWAQPSLNGKPSIRSTPDNQGTIIVIYGKYQG